MFNDDIFEPLLLESNALHHSAMGGGMFDRGEVEIYNHFIWHKFDGKNGIMEWADKMADNPQNHIQKLGHMHIKCTHWPYNIFKLLLGIIIILNSKTL